MQKDSLIVAAKKTFFSYLRLDFVREYQLNIDGKKISFTDYVQKLLDNGTISPENKEHPLKIGDTDYVVELKVNGQKSDVILKKPIPITHHKKPKIKEDIKDYQEDEVAELLSYNKFRIHRDKNNNLHFGLPIKVRNKIVELGGPRKLPLYRSHLVTLRKMIAHLEEHDDIKAMLVALTTGSGKTFVQCLWYFTLVQAGMGGIFSLPDHLVDQFKKDFKRLLPDQLVNQLHILRRNGGNNNKTAVNAINQLNEEPAYIIASYEELLDHHFDTLLDADPDKLTLVFDEQHIVMEHENRRVKLIELAKKLLAVFSTATPDSKTFEMCANKPVAVMSAAQKKLEGQGDFPRVNTVISKSLKSRMKDVKNLRLLERILGPILLNFANAIEPDISSPIMTALEELHHYVLCENNNPDTHRKNLQMPVKRKILALMPNNVDELINLDNFVNRHTREVYAEGNLRHREGVFSFFQIPDVDREIANRHQDQLNTNFAQKLNALNVSYEVPRHRPELNNQLDRNIHHNMLDAFLSDLTGLSVIELNKYRQENLDKLIELADAAFEKLPDSEEYIAAWEQKLTYVPENDKGIPENKNGIDAQRAQQVANIMDNIAKKYRKSTANVRRLIVNNWAFDEEFHSNLHIDGLKNFAKAHRVLCVMKGMEYAETPIEDSVPFFGFDQEYYDLYDHNGMLSEKAKKIKRTPLQILDDATREYRYTPNYDRTINESIADNLSKWGFVGIYASNKKAEGFSDLNLHTVISTIPSSDDDNNDPAKMIQSIGRNRGLDPTVRPFYLQSTGENTTLTFNLEQLEVTDDYYPPYFSAEKKFKKIYLKRLGKHVVSDIKRWYHQNLDKTHQVNPITLKWQTLRTVVMALRRMNNKNAHDIKLSRRHLIHMLSEVRKEIAQELYEIKNPYKLSLFVSFIGSLLHGIASTYYFFRNVGVHLQFRAAYMHEKSLLRKAKKADPDSDDAKLRTANVAYGKIVTKLKFRNLIRESLVGNEFKNILTRERNAIEAILETNVPLYLKDEKIAEFNETIREKILPLMMQFFDDSLHDQITVMAENYDQWHLALYKHRKKLKHFEKHPEKIAAAILKEAPEIAELLKNEETHNYIQELKDFEKAHPLEFTDSQKLLNILRELLSTDDFERIEPILCDPEQFEHFIKTLTPKIKHQDFDIKMLMSELKTEHKDNFNNTELQLAPELAKEATMHFKNELTTYLTEAKVKDLNNSIREKILPLMIHFYDPFLHDEITKLANEYDQWHTVFYKQRERLESFESDPQNVSKLILTQAPAIAALLNKQNTRDYFGALANIETTPLLELLSSDKLVSIMRELFSGETLKVVEPIVSSKLKMGPFFLKLSMRMRSETLDLKDILVAFSEYFKDSLNGVELKIIPNVALEALNTIERDLSHENSFDKAKVNAMIQKTLAYLIHFYDPKLHPQLTQLAKNHDNWHAILFKHLIEVQDFENNPQKVAALLLQEVPEIKKLLENETPRDYMKILEDISTLKPATLADPKKILAMMKKLYSPSVFKVIQPIISNEEKFNAFLESLNSFDFDNIMDEFKLYFKKELGDIEFTLIAELATDTAAELELELNLTKTYDKNKISQVIQDRIKDTIMHPRFYTVCRRTFGILNREELREVVKAIRKSDDNLKAEKNADDIYDFLQLLKRRDFNGIADQFIQLDDEKENIEDAFKNTRLVDVIDTIKDLFEELIDVQGNYHGMSSKGEQTGHGKSKLSNYITDDRLTGIQTHTDHNFVSFISRKIFYLQGLRKGLPDAGDISAFGNRDLTNHLKRIKEDIIKPLWWSSNKTAVGRKLIQAGQTIKAFFRPKSYQMPEEVADENADIDSTLELDLSSLNQSVDAKTPKIHSNQQLSNKQLKSNYQEDAYQTGYKISQLNRFTLFDVKQEDCKVDTIESVLDPILRHLPDEQTTVKLGG